VTGIDGILVRTPRISSQHRISLEVSVPTGITITTPRHGRMNTMVIVAESSETMAKTLHQLNLLFDRVETAISDAAEKINFP